MSDTLNRRIAIISEEILQYLLDYKTENPDFTFSLRKQDSSRSKEKRLEKGFWFQGSNYIYIGFFKKGDQDRKIQTIGFVLNFDQETGDLINNYIEISFKGGMSPEDTDFHTELAKRLNIEIDPKNFFGKGKYKGLDYLQNLKVFINTTLPTVHELLKKHKLTDQYLISEAEFQKMLVKTNSIRDKFLESVRKMKTSHHPLNQILYGPPGTGKTYNTINKALAIIQNISEKELIRKIKSDLKKANKNDSEEGIERQVRIELKKRFQEYLDNGQIVFTTFHQSMSYEDFVEGIKPSSENGELSYDIEDGIFKTIASKAQAEENNFEATIANLKEELLNTEKMEGLEIPNGQTSFGLTYRGGKVFHVQPQDSSKENPWYPVNIAKIQRLFETGNEEGVYNITYARRIIEYLKDKKGLVSENTKKETPHVLIIDEINRGNIAAIFGELITLIEDDKRLSAPEELTLTLPYSKEPFGVPKNLHIIGTMNTADRSVEALDSALRRRFQFIEMPPRPELLLNEEQTEEIVKLWNDDQYNIKRTDEDWYGKDFREVADALYSKLGITRQIEEMGIDKGERKKWAVSDFGDRLNMDLPLTNFLTTLNKRLEALLDRDHAIGHSYLINLKNLQDFKTALQHKIIPLLQEYFYNDYAKIGLVLGQGFVAKEDSETTFANFDDSEHDIQPHPTYHLANVENMTDEEFKEALIDFGLKIENK
ncbi:hypothetical protein FUAX_54380 (plasmid) [Fulvitalea axinellae]|uniref:AAA+ ATPase domain-containing protein n=1 Tax=Fulvitalea axinellae TaxID=1182444 RepID=A0AAU9CVC4_9BACT|nr:hypothetical protein FUAX_54380 [Fulvitalea axinellae]